MAGVDWGYYDRFEKYDDRYLPGKGEGHTMATQTVTACSKLVYKWYNDGDVYDNVHGLEGWCNDLSSYANWLAENVDGCRDILEKVFDIGGDEDEYEYILKELVDFTHADEELAKLDMKPAIGSIYDCDGPFEWSDPYEDNEEEW